MDEEQGLIGANGLQKGFVSAISFSIWIPEEIGTACGWMRRRKVTICRLPYTKESAPVSAEFFKVRIADLKGGHSGMEIGLGRANANQQLARFLWEANRIAPLELGEIDGGGLANAIPRDAMAVVAVAREDVEAFKAYAREFDVMVHKEFEATENREFIFEVTEVKASCASYCPRYGPQANCSTVCMSQRRAGNVDSYQKG